MRKLDHGKIVADARKIMKENPKATKTAIAAKFGISDSWLCHLLKIYPEESEPEKVFTEAKKTTAKQDEPNIPKNRKEKELIKPGDLVRIPISVPNAPKIEKVATKQPDFHKLVVDAMTEELKKHGAFEEGETVKVFVMNKNVDYFFSTVPIAIEINIPAGLKGDKREMAINNIAFNNLKVVEIGE